MFLIERFTTLLLENDQYSRLIDSVATFWGVAIAPKRPVAYAKTITEAITTMRIMRTSAIIVSIPRLFLKKRRSNNSLAFVF